MKYILVIIIFLSSNVYAETFCYNPITLESYKQENIKNNFFNQCLSLDEAKKNQKQLVEIAKSKNCNKRCQNARKILDNNKIKY